MPLRKAKRSQKVLSQSLVHALNAVVRNTKKLTNWLKKVKPTALKRPTAARVTTEEEMPEEDTTYTSAMRPQIGTEVSNAEIDRPATVPEEKPEILKSGEEAIIPAAKEAVEGFVPDEEVLEQNNEEQP